MEKPKRPAATLAFIVSPPRLKYGALVMEKTKGLAAILTPLQGVKWGSTFLSAWVLRRFQLPFLQ
jgi:hypothetical protein